MAFPPRGSGAGDSQLNGPPPSPTAMSGGGDTPFSMRGMMPPGAGGAPGVGPEAIPPEVLRGVMQTADTMGASLDTFSQLFPAEAAGFAMVKDLLQQLLAKIVGAAGSPAISPTSTGAQFPGGGMDRGISGPGAV